MFFCSYIYRLLEQIQGTPTDSLTAQIERLCSKSSRQDIAALGENKKTGRLTGGMYFGSKKLTSVEVKIMVIYV